ncbi:MAG: hypothetical protein PHO75_02315 [Candidatus Shapirobacteria bacterium]|nr:hypothetical protein [Candidatus Shapirobacteria bacterium]
MKNILKKLIWWLTDRCLSCGGEVESWDNFESFNCSKCGKSTQGWPMREEIRNGFYLTFDRKKRLVRVQGYSNGEEVLVMGLLGDSKL